ncbi:hypothetical protein Taro_025152 [Colocasia esculenta]|uniref:Uncharacterized protein n=1 Tax=Colocasia esculenta TaxID=4460 RepID=A0A843VMJ2_COLES|nr:hypothetical protein [Colocasia esculenta]
MKGGGGGGAGFSELSDEERRALRGSKFAPLPPSDHPSSSSRCQPRGYVPGNVVMVSYVPVFVGKIWRRLAHPGGPLATNKAAALAKFLERKLLQPGGLDSIDPDILELAVKNAKETVKSTVKDRRKAGPTPRDGSVPSTTRHVRANRRTAGTDSGICVPPSYGCDSKDHRRRGGVHAAATEANHMGPLRVPASPSLADLTFLSRAWGVADEGGGTRGGWGWGPQRVGSQIQKNTERTVGKRGPPLT